MVTMTQEELDARIKEGKATADECMKMLLEGKRLIGMNWQLENEVFMLIMSKCEFENLDFNDLLNEQEPRFIDAFVDHLFKNEKVTDTNKGDVLRYFKNIAYLADSKADQVIDLIENMDLSESDLTDVEIIIERHKFLNPTGCYEIVEAIIKKYGPDSPEAKRMQKRFRGYSQDSNPVGDLGNGNGAYYQQQSNLRNQVAFRFALAAFDQIKAQIQFPKPSDPQFFSSTNKLLHYLQSLRESMQFQTDHLPLISGVVKTLLTPEARVALSDRVLKLECELVKNIFNTVADQVKDNPAEMMKVTTVLNGLSKTPPMSEKEFNAIFKSESNPASPSPLTKAFDYKVLVAVSGMEQGKAMLTEMSEKFSPPKPSNTPRPA